MTEMALKSAENHIIITCVSHTRAKISLMLLYIKDHLIPLGTCSDSGREKRGFSCETFGIRYLHMHLCFNWTKAVM